MIMALFWYPQINYDIRKPDKSYMIDSYTKYYLARLESMFRYEGLPDTIPAKWLEHYLLCNGNAAIIKYDDKLYAVTGGMGEIPNAYYIPSRYIVANPYLKGGMIPEKADDLSMSKTYIIDKDCVVIWNDTYSQGVMPLLLRYIHALVENDITMNIADILARATLNISAADDQTRKSAELYLNRLEKGELAVIAEKAFIDGLKISEFTAAANSLTNLIEYHQYIKASLYNELGLNSNYNMKRESINSNESQLNDDMLHPLIDTMLRERQEGVERINKMFGTDIKVTFNSAWEENEKEEQLFIAGLESEVENTETEDDTKIYPDSFEQIEETDETIDEEEVTTETSEDNEIPSDEEQLTPAEELVDAIEAIVEDIVGGGEDNGTEDDN